MATPSHLLADLKAYSVYSKDLYICSLSLSLFSSRLSKEQNFTKESSWRGRLHVHVKRAVRPAHATFLQHKKPTSSAADGITGGSRLTSQTVLRQEVPTATSKSYTFKTSMVI
ncbi:hypothetical protein Bca4012_071764 [Brassica carinata]|uniref:Uncharacterized protein n=1 Tax=Brassica carinata TaxID=52824 RepID=A0A8X7QH62_BRACI|nr:hypothetical protein Bca52824_064028 [Brassica carinata]